MTTTKDKILWELERLYPKRKQLLQFLESPQSILNGGVPNELIEDGREMQVLIALREF